MKALDQTKLYAIEQHKSYLSHGLEALFLLTGDSLFLLSPNTFDMLDMEKGIGAHEKMRTFFSYLIEILYTNFFSVDWI